MKKIIVLFTLLCALPAWAEEETVSTSSDAEGKHIAVTVVRDDWTIECRLDSAGKMTGFYIVKRVSMNENSRLDISVDFQDGRAHAVHFHYVRGYEEDYSASFWKDNPKNKPLFSVAERLAKKLYKDYGLKKLAREEAAKKQEEYRQFREEEKRKEAEKAKARPDPESILKKFLK